MPASRGRLAGGAGTTAGRGATIRSGLAALGKCTLLLAGVPATLVRLWLLTSTPGRPWTSGGALATHAVLTAVAAGWLVAGSALVRDLVGAFARRPLDPSSWSRRWALRLAALVLMLLAGGASAATGRARPTAPAAASVPAPHASLGAAGEPWPAGTSGHVPLERATPRPPAPAVAGMVAEAGVGALVGAALAGRARLLRRAAAALRRPGERQARPSTASAQLEVVLGALGGDALVAWVDGANRLLWRSLREAAAPAPMPDVRLVRVGPDGVELYLGAVSVPLDGFHPLEGGRWWCLDPTLGLEELEARTQGCGRLLPGLLPIGEDGTAAYLLNVPPGRRLALRGDPARAEGALRGLTLALRCLPWADELAAELVGLEPPDPSERCYQLSASSPEELAALAEGPPYDLDRRTAERWSRQPLVVSALGGAPGHGPLLERCRPQAGVVVLGGRGDDELVLDDAGAWLEPGGLRLMPLCPSPAEAALADRLLAEAAAATAPAPSAQAAPDPAEGLVAPGRVEVRLLDGPPRLEGGLLAAVAERDRTRAIEVVANLSLRGGTATTEELLEDLLLPPRRPEAAEQLERMLAAARAALGTAGDGTALLRRPRADRAELHPEVSLDAGRLARAAGAARAAPPEQAERLLRDALALVGPRPCLPPSFPWLATSGRREEVVAGVVDAAHHLALLALAKADTVLARWAIAQGRHAEPCAEVLARDLMLACDAEGDAEGTIAAWQALEDGLAGLGGHEPSEETRELFASLVHRPR